MVDYAGEEHPATVKRSIVVSVGQLPLRGDDAIHNIKLLAGSRWTPEPPLDSGVGPNEPDREHGYIKISCEDFPKPAMNLKWASDALDRLIAEANVALFVEKNAYWVPLTRVEQNPENKFGKLPIDTRHVIAKARKAKKGEHIRGRVGRRASLRDFPEEWLPTLEETTPDGSSGGQ
jgi:small subunit ribosomal protein S35